MVEVLVPEMPTLGYRKQARPPQFLAAEEEAEFQTGVR